MQCNFNYPAKITRNKDNRFIVTFPNFGRGVADGATREEALIEAKDLLRELLATEMRRGRQLPVPSRASKRDLLVTPPTIIALKAALYVADRQSEVSHLEIAEALETTQNQVQWLLSPDHALKIVSLDAMLEQLGASVTITVTRNKPT